jgi:alkyldihydroxyacetonephosphate synthase
VDAAVYPRFHEDVENIVKLACKHNVVLIPYGGGTNVTHALLINTEETRMVVSVDMSKMNHVRMVDRENMVALVETGIAGKDLEKELERYGVCSGHEPDSQEFSTLGGWISTRASGMKKNRYGNIEDIVITFKVVTPQGTWVRPCNSPRISTGPELNHLFMGHEGNFGIITEALIKVKDIPEVRDYGSLVFPTFDHGCAFMYEVGRVGLRPASLRLVDNAQFQFAVALKANVESTLAAVIEKMKKYYVTEIKKFDPNQLSVATVVFEGDK